MTEPWTPFTRAEIIKCDPGRDFYVAWSHIAEAPSWAGTRAQAVTAGCTPDRLDRADVHGSSWYLRDQYGQPQPGCWWHDDGLIAEQLGYLPRARLAAYVTAYYCQDRPGAAYAMLQRFGGVSRKQHCTRIRQALYYHDPASHDLHGCGHCRDCHPEQDLRPLAVDGREYRRRQRARQRRRRKRA